MQHVKHCTMHGMEHADGMAALALQARHRYRSAAGYIYSYIVS